MTKVATSTRYSVLVCLVLVLVQVASASWPWEGDCTVLERLVNILASVNASNEITDEDLGFLIENLRSNDDVIVALSAYALGRMDRDHDLVRAALTDAIARNSELTQFSYDLGATFCKIGLLELGLRHDEKEVMLETYRPLLLSDDLYLRFWAARVLTHLQETDGVQEALRSVADSDTALNNAADMLLLGHPLNPVVTPPAYIIIEGVIFGEMEIAPCLGLLGLERPARFDRWKGDCGKLHKLVLILENSRESKRNVIEDRDQLIEALQTPELVVASLAAYILGNGTGGDEVTHALQKRLEIADATGPGEEMVSGFCLFALTRLASRADEELISKLQILISESDNPYLLTLTMDELISMRHTEELQNELIERRGKGGDYTDSSLDQILYMLRYPNKPRVFTGPLEFQLVLRLINGAPTTGLCESKDTSRKSQENK